MKYNVNNTMSKNIITVKMDESLEVASELLEEHGIRHLPVIDDFGDVVGVLSQRDIQRAVLRDKYDKASIGHPFIKDAKVGCFMSWPIITISEDADLGEACNQMIEKKISALLIVSKGELTGIITQEDLLRVMARLLRPPTTLLEDVERIAYNSPVGAVAKFLSDIGI